MILDALTMTQFLGSRIITLRDLTERATVGLLVVAFLSSCSSSLPKLSSKEMQHSHDSITSNYDNKRALKRALAYWSKEYSKDRKNPTTAYNYANNLVIAGKVQRAFKVLQEAIKHNPNDEKLISEYGRLSLRLNKVSLAQKVLDRIDGKPITDWRTLSARGTLKARKGHYAEAHKDFDEALKLAPDESSVLNNKALAYVLDGKPKKAEEILQKLITNPKADKRIANNLALVLGLQGKFRQAEAVGRQSMPIRLVKSNMDYLKRLIKKPVGKDQAAPVTKVKAKSY